MKRLIAILGGLLLATGVFAQNYLAQSLLTVSAIATGTNGLGSGGVTNLSQIFTNAGMVLSTNIVYTNAGVVVRSSGLTNTISTKALFNTAALWNGRDGQNILQSVPLGNSVADPTNYLLGALSMRIILSNPYGSNGPVGIVFCPVWKSGTVTPNRSWDWGVVVPGAAGAVNEVVTNVPTWKWPGAYGLTVRYITNQFNITAADGTTNCPYLTTLDLIGFRP